jgi:hypothetical protein
METQTATIHLSPQMLTTRPFALRHRAEPVKKKKIAKVTCRTPNQPPNDLQKNIENGRGRWRHSRSNKEKKKKWKLQVPTKENSGVPVTVNL